MFDLLQREAENQLKWVQKQIPGMSAFPH